MIVCSMAKARTCWSTAYWVWSTHLPVIKFPALRNKHGRSVGYIRNSQISLIADKLVTSWDGQSRGTQPMIQFMEGLGKPVRIVRY